MIGARMALCKQSSTCLNCAAGGGAHFCHASVKSVFSDLQNNSSLGGLKHALALVNLKHRELNVKSFFLASISVILLATSNVPVHAEKFANAESDQTPVPALRVVSPKFAGNLSGKYQCDRNGTLTLTQNPYKAQQRFQNGMPKSYIATLNFANGMWSALDELEFSDHQGGKMLSGTDDPDAGLFLVVDKGRCLRLSFYFDAELTCCKQSVGRR